MSRQVRPLFTKMKRSARGEPRTASSFGGVVLPASLNKVHASTAVSCEIRAPNITLYQLSPVCERVSEAKWGNVFSLIYIYTLISESDGADGAIFERGGRTE